MGCKNIRSRDVEKTARGGMRIRRGLTGKPGLVMFWNKSCGWCEMAKPFMVQLAHETSYSMFYFEINGANLPPQRVKYVPEVRFVDASGRISGDKFTGDYTKENLLQYIKQHL